MGDWGVLLERSLSVGSDIERAEALYHTLCPDSNDLMVLTHFGPPKSKARPRFVRGGRQVYNPSQPAQTELAWRFKAARIPKHEGNVALGAIFFRPNHQRVDVDNCLKLVLDAGTEAGLWNDDAQVTALLGIMELDKLKPRTVIMLGSHESTLDRSAKRFLKVCLVCGGSFSVEDAAKIYQRFCSPKCRFSALAKPRRQPVGKGRGPKNQPPPTCVECGTGVSKRGYLRCRACWKGARAKAEG